MTFTSTLSLSALLCGASILSLTAFGAAHAQSAAPEASTIGEVVVTGTRIRGIEPVGSAVIPIGQDDIAKAGVTSTTELLRQIPQVNSYGADESTVSGGSFVQGSILNNTFARAANLRGLGTTATLVLVDGHRVAPGGQAGQLVDLDAIPQSAIARAEVVADGASALYGSDAVAGVINFVLRRDFDGAETTARYGFADGTQQYTLSQTFGKTWDSGGFFVALERQHRDPLKASDRANLYNDDLRPYGGSAPPPLSNPGNVLIGGVSYAIPGGQNGAGVTLGQLGPRGSANLQSAWEGQTVLPEQTRNTFVATFDQQITETLKFSADALYTKREFSQVVAASNSGAGGLAVPSSNPFSPCNPARSQINTQGIVCPANGVVNVQYAFGDDLGNQVRAGDSELWSIRGGLDWTLPNQWSANLSTSYSENREYVGTRNGVNATALNAALAGSAPYAVGRNSGVLVRPANVPALNLFCGGAACNDPATLNFIRTLSEQPARYQYNNLSLGADGPLFALPGGEVRMAVGAEYRRDALLNQNRSTVFASGALNSLNVTGGTRTVRAAFGELYVPLVGDGNAMAGVQRLDLSLAARVEDYSDFGTTTNPKIGLTWQPIEGLTARATYGKSFRAPTLSDTDPASTGVLRAVPFTAAQAAQLGLPAVGTLSAIQTQGGTTGIDPETATTYSFGVDYRPTQAPGLSMSVNYYNIAYKNRIDSPGLNAGALAAISSRPLYNSVLAYNPTYFPGSGLSQAEFDRRVAAIVSSPRPEFTGAPPATSNVVAILTGNRDNTGALETSGFDLSAEYQWENGLGEWRVGGMGTYVLEYAYSVLPGAPSIDYVNEFNTIGSPLRFRGRLEAGWERGGLSVTGGVNYQNSYTFPRVLMPAGTPSQYGDIDANTTVDLTVSYDTGDTLALAMARNVRFTLSVQNLFDRDPPLVINSGGQPILFDNTNAGALGRFAAFQITKSW